MTYQRLLGMDPPKNASTGESQSSFNLEKGTNDTGELEDESKCPSQKIVILSMLSIYFAFFLTALVSPPRLIPQTPESDPAYLFRTIMRNIKEL